MNKAIHYFLIPILSFGILNSPFSANATVKNRSDAPYDARNDPDFQRLVISGKINGGAPLMQEVNPSINRRNKDYSFGQKPNTDDSEEEEVFFSVKHGEQAKTTPKVDTSRNLTTKEAIEDYRQRFEARVRALDRAHMTVNFEECNRMLEPYGLYLTNELTVVYLKDF